MENSRGLEKKTQVGAPAKPGGETELLGDRVHGNAVGQTLHQVGALFIAQNDQATLLQVATVGQGVSDEYSAMNSSRPGMTPRCGFFT